MIGGPGFCQPVLRWDGNTYVFDRNVAEQPGGCDGRWMGRAAQAGSPCGTFPGYSL